MEDIEAPTVMASWHAQDRSLLRLLLNGGSLWRRILFKTLRGFDSASQSFQKPVIKDSTLNCDQHPLYGLGAVKGFWKLWALVGYDYCGHYP